MEERFKNINITFACREQYFEYLSNDSNSIVSNTINQKSSEVGGIYGVIFPIIYNASNELHPILNLIKDCNLKIEKYVPKNPNNHYGVVCPEGNFPTKSLNMYQTTQLRSWIQSRGFKPLVIGVDKHPTIKERINIARTSGFVVGVECDMLYEAIESGVPTALVPTSNHSRELYESMTENPIILNC